MRRRLALSRVLLGRLAGRRMHGARERPEARAAHAPRMIALLALGLLVAGGGCGLHVTQSRAFTLTGTALIEESVATRQAGLGERRLPGAAVRVLGPTLDGTGITVVATGTTDAMGQFGLIIPHNSVALHSNFTYGWAVEITAEVYVNDVPQTVRLHAAFAPKGTQLVERNVNLASTIVARNLEPWLRSETGAPEMIAAQRSVAYAETPLTAGSNEAIEALETQVSGLLGQPPAGMSPVGMAMLTDLNHTTGMVCEALTDSIQLAANGSEVATTAAAGATEVAAGATTTLNVRATQDGQPIGWAIEVVNADGPAGGPSVPATVADLAQTGPATLRLTGKHTGTAQIQASVGGGSGAKMAHLTLNVTP